jgi:hypothetical protein
MVGALVVHVAGASLCSSLPAEDVISVDTCHFTVNELFCHFLEQCSTCCKSLLCSGGPNGINENCAVNNFIILSEKIRL